MPSTSFDVVIIGGGIAGINAAYRLQTEFPRCSFTILEARNDIGGTWALFRYPGIRSDSDLFTFGLQWFPWNQSNPIAEGGDILRYLDDAVSASDIKRHIRLNHRVNAAKWEGGQWNLEVENENETQELSSRFIIFATGYYDHGNPLDTVIPGLEDFKGEVIHPQFWPEKFDGLGKKIVVIGSGATAVTLIPSLAEDAESVTMLQRSPTYFASLPNARLNSFWTRFLPSRVLYYLRRLQYLIFPQLFYYFCRSFPGAARSMLQKGVQKQLAPDVPLNPHFKPSYNPWEQRLCVCPDGDFFKSLRSTKARVETDVIQTVDESGIQLKSGKRLDADVIVTATGLKMRFFGGIPIYINGEKLEPTKKYLWNGVMLQDLPNATLVVGFVNASWTLGADLAMRLTCRLLKQMERDGHYTAIPTAEANENLIPTKVMRLTSTYLTRGAKDMPKSTDARPWVGRISYFSDLYFASFGDLRTGLCFS